MKKALVMLTLIFALMVSAVAFAQDDASYSVVYNANDCVAEVPTDGNSYAAGDEVTVLFEPIAYKDYLVFYGWDINDDGIADFGYNYKTFTMPAENVELKAVCLTAYAAPSCSGCHLHGVPAQYYGIRSFTY